MTGHHQCEGEYFRVTRLPALITLKKSSSVSYSDGDNVVKVSEVMELFVKVSTMDSPSLGLNLKFHFSGFYN